MFVRSSAADGAGADPGGDPVPAGEAGGEAEEAAGAGDPGPRGARAAGRLVSAPITVLWSMPCACHDVTDRVSPLVR